MFLLRLFCLVPLVWAQLRMVEPPFRVDMPPPDEASRISPRNVATLWITMPIDHFNPLNNETFQMRYMVNEQFFGGPDSPIFIMVGGEWNIAAGWLLTGNMFEMARENHGYMAYTEHRYYGETVPFTNFTIENLRFLNVDQALGDLAYFIRDLKQQARFANSKVVLYGGSYAANMALWFKQRYPHLAVGAVASSGPIKGKVNYHEYLEVVEEAFLLEGGEQCVAHLRQGIADTITAMETEAGRRALESTYRLCDELDYDDRLLMGYFSGMITWAFSGTVQTARPGVLRDICNIFNANGFGSTPMAQIAGFIAWRGNWGPEGCLELELEHFLNVYRAPRSNSRAWYYQTCTEYGYFQIAPSSGTVFDPLYWLDVDFYVHVCLEAYDEMFDAPFVYDAVERVNLMFGALGPNVQNTINIHGHIDPWRALGVYDRNLTDTSPTYNVPRASHCFDMQPWLQTDTIRMTHTQQRARRTVASWLAY